MPLDGNNEHTSDGMQAFANAQTACDSQAIAERQTLDDKALIALHLNGDTEAFEALVLRYERRIAAAAYQLCGSREEGEDLAQETFVKAWRALSGYRGQASFGAWLAAILTNTWRDRLRKGTVPTQSLDAPIESDEGTVARQVRDSAPGPDAVTESAEPRDVISTMIQELRQEYKEALILRDVQGFSYEEVAAITGSSLGTVKSRISRARSHLKERILHYQEQNPGYFRLNQVRTDGSQTIDARGGEADEG